MDLDREREDWDLLADDLGLVFDAGLKPFLESSAAKRLIVESEIKENPNTEQALAVLENSDIQKLLE
ncbi:MAG: hypothetical protein JKX97_08785, partial [Candidatus Lindowbacteria bacterium]|nr:hypothetical protein [Candidatus Lindowbacteria bacterium]